MHVSTRFVGYRLLVALGALIATSGAFGQSPLPIQWCNRLIGAPQCLAVSPNGSVIAVGGGSSIQILDAVTGSVVRCIPTVANQGVYCLAFSPDGKMIADGCLSVDPANNLNNGVIEVWTVSDAQPVATLKSVPHQWIWGVAFSPDGKSLADVGEIDGATYSSFVEIWDIASANLAANFNSRAQNLYSVAFSPDGTLLLDGGRTMNASNQYVGVLETWNVASKSSAQQFATTAALGVYSAAFSPDGRSIVSGGQGTGSTTGVLELWDTPSGALLKSLPTGISGTSNSGIWSVAFSPDGTTIVDGGNTLPGTYKGSIELWNAASGTRLTTLPTVADRQVGGVGFSKDGGTLYDCGQANPSGSVVEGWNIGTYGLKFGGALTQFVDALGIAFSPDGQTLAVAGGTYDSILGHYIGGAVDLRDAHTGASIASLKSAATRLISVAMSPDNTTLACGGVFTDSSGTSTGVLEIWNTSTQTRIATLATAATNVLALAFSPDGNTLAVGGGDPTFFLGTVELWSLQTGKRIASLPTTNNKWVNTLAFTPDGGALVEGGYGYNTGTGKSPRLIEMWDVASGTLTRSLSTNADTVTALAISSDGSSMIDVGTTSNQPKGVVEIWNLTTYTTTSSSVGGSPVNAVAYSPQGNVCFYGIDRFLFAVDPETGNQLGTYKWPCQSLVCSPDGSQVGFLSWSGEMMAENPFFLDPIASVSFPSGTVQGGSSLTGTVTVQQPAPSSGTVVSLTSDSSNASVPSTVTVTGGATSATFTLATSAVSGDTTVHIKATNATGSQSATLTISAATLAALSLSPNESVGGNPSTGVVTLSGPTGPKGTVVTLSSSDPAASVPTSVTVAAGQTSATFGVTTGAVGQDTTVVISATLGGKSETANLTLHPAGLASIMVGPSSGNGVAIGTVQLSGKAKAGGFALTLSSSNATAAKVPGVLTIPAGKSTGSFNVTESAVSKSITVTITAKAGNTSRSTTLTMSPPVLDGLTLNPNSVIGGSPSTGTLTLSGPTPSGGMIVSLASKNSAVKIPATVMVAAGKSSATFAVTTQPVASQKPVTIQATLFGTTKTATLTVNAPTLVLVSLTPASVIGGHGATGAISFSGPAPAGGLNVKVSSSSTAATTPASVSVAAGKSSATFDVSTVPVGSDVKATISAQSGSVTKTVSLTVQAPSLKALTLSPSQVTGGKSSTATLSITSAAPSGGLKVSMSSSLAAANVPSSVTIPAGKTIATFSIQTKKVTGKSEATIGATLGSQTKSAVLTIS
ncbi:MAG: hypothetical protein P4L46_25885 [Fimbriimonas sp.]|nr:hypothetical protein [Fimbriimonas sp.]